MSPYDRAAPPQQVESHPVAEFIGYEDGGRPLFRLLNGPLKVGEKLYCAPAAPGCEICAGTGTAFGKTCDCSKGTVRG
jgi:hypothetical protein